MKNLGVLNSSSVCGQLQKKVHNSKGSKFVWGKFHMQNIYTRNNFI